MKQGVKSVISLLLAAVLLCGNALAVGETYSFEEFDFEVTAPEGDFYILTRDMSPEDPTLVDVGMTAEQVKEILEPANIYLDALYYDASYELVVTVLEGEDFEAVFNYDLLSKLQRDAATSAGTRELERQGYTVKGNSFWYEGEEAVFAVQELVPPDGSATWVYQYQTIYNGRAVVASASSIYLDTLTDEIREQTRLLAESIHFTRKLPVPEEVQKAYEEDEEEPTILMDILKNALIGAVVGGGGYIVFDLLRKRKGKKIASADEKLEGGDEP